MKTSRQCPKCSGREIIRIDGDVGSAEHGNTIFIGATIFSAVNVNRYVCTGCGYSEEWIDPEDLKRLKNSRKAIQV